MKKNILKQIKVNILTKEEKKTIVGGYANGVIYQDWPCSFISCRSRHNVGAKVSKPGCSTNNLYIYKPNPVLYCQF